MQFEDAHLSDRELVEAADGESSPQRARRAEAHLAACWECRARKQELESAIAGFVRLHRREFDPLMPPVAGSRALLKAQLAALTAGQPRATLWTHRFAQVFLACAFVILATFVMSRWTHVRRPHPAPLSVPSGRMTPGFATPLTRAEVCEGNPPKNRAVPAPLQRRVLAAYGLSGADPRAYEIDYLITPALGGADDIRNLWPQPYYATIWNARVKDELEDRLRTLVCSGSLDLATAQHEIAKDWVAAYKKYFHTNLPVANQ